MDNGYFNKRGNAASSLEKLLSILSNMLFSCPAKNVDIEYRSEAGAGVKLGTLNQVARSHTNRILSQVQHQKRMA